MSFQSAIAALPSELQTLAYKQVEALQPVFESMPSLPDQFHQDCLKVLIGSDFVVEQLSRRQSTLPDLIAGGGLERQYELGEYAARLRQRILDLDDEAAFHRQLRVFRNYEMVRLIWRDLTRKSDTRNTVIELSALADACIDEALNWLYAKACKRWGVPQSRPNSEGITYPQQLVVLGMGKLGAKELNLSSDIDLIFCYPKNGETDHERSSLENQDFFIRLGQKLIQALDNLTLDGFVFRVDMRLRPFGSAGPLAISFNAMENYYQEQGRDWERYAMVKVRPVAGDLAEGERLLTELRPFVYRKYIDFSAFESLRDMKQMINREVRRKGLEQNVKLGSGGIREIEFIAQAFQLIRGGRDRDLQQRELLNILPLLPDKIGMPIEAVNELAQAYLFLRDTEHAIQAIADKQTQELPDDPLGQARIAFSMGFLEWQAFSDQLSLHRQAVSRHFADVIAPVVEDDDEEDKAAEQWMWLFKGEIEQAQALEFLTEKGFEEAQAALKLLSDLRNSRTMQLTQQVARERLYMILPELLERIVTCDNSTQTLERVLLLIEAVLRRSAYLVLLAENPGALQQLVRLCSASAWFSVLLAKQPVLLDELIDPRTLFTPPDKARLQAELNQQLLRISEQDTEQLMEALRYFKHAHVLKVAASDITGALPLMKVSDYLTWLAEVLLAAVLDNAWRGLVEKHGYPMTDEGPMLQPRFIVLGYGKLGGIELSYGSDLDLVFIHDSDPNLSTDGEKSLSNAVFFNRLGQRVIHLLNTFTPSGQLYEIDMRLRPSGNSGLLVSSLKAFSDYQHKEAWTWEHQALIRARVVTGDSELAAAFEQVRADILSKLRDRSRLLDEVVHMREKMRQHLSSKDTTNTLNVFDLKQDRGGIVDIEFMVQFLVLAHAKTFAELYTYTDNIRILDALEAVQILTAEQAENLREAYKAFRSVGHRQSLQEQSNTVIADEELGKWRECVVAIWDEVMTS